MEENGSASRPGPCCPGEDGPPSFRGGWQSYLWAGQGNSRKWNSTPPAPLPPTSPLATFHTQGQNPGLNSLEL